MKRVIVDLDEEMANGSPGVAGSNPRLKRAMRRSYLISLVSDPTPLWIVGSKAAANIIAQEAMDTTRANVWTLAEVRDLLEPFGVKVKDTYEAALAMAYDPGRVPADSPAPYSIPVQPSGWTDGYDDDDGEW